MNGGKKNVKKEKKQKINNISKFFKNLILNNKVRPRFSAKYKFKENLSLIIFIKKLR